LPNSALLLERNLIQKITRKNKPQQIHRLSFLMISKILQPSSKITEFKARFEPLNSLSKLKTPGYHPSSEEFC